MLIAHRDLAASSSRPPAGLEADEHHADIRRRDEMDGVEAGELHDVLDAGHGQGDFAHLAHHGVGAVDGGRLGQLQDREQVLLVLGRDVAALHGAEADDRDDDQHRVNREQSRRTADRAADAARIAVAEAAGKRG